MANDRKDSTSNHDPKPGSESVHVERPHDFGISPSQTSEARYASSAILNQDKGRSGERSAPERDGRRDVGVGVNSGGAGAGSGGDLDLDIVGVGTGGSGLSQNPVRKRDELQQHLVTGRIDRDRPAITPADPADAGLGVGPEAGAAIEDQGLTGADAVRSGSGNDPFAEATAGEISSDEANGTDNEEGVELDDENP